MSTILLTGATGFLGTHILSLLLSTTTHTILLPLRSSTSIPTILSLFPSHSSRLRFTIVPDITTPKAYDTAVADADYIIHCASPFQVAVLDNEKDLLQPAIQGTVGLLNSVKDKGLGVKKVVLTGSFGGVVDLFKGMREGYTYTEEDWNPVTYDMAKSGPGPLAYAASKKLAEEAAWDFMQTHAPPFTLTTILPPMIYGPLMHTPSSLADLNTSSKDIYRLIMNLDTAPPTHMPAFADVRDVALAHVKALEVEGTGGRILVANGGFTYGQVCDFLREEIPDIAGRLPKQALDEGGFYGVDTAKAKKELGIEFRGLKETFGDAFRRLLEIERDLAPKA